jgi:hypothetical protein
MPAATADVGDAGTLRASPEGWLTRINVIGRELCMAL